MDPVSWVVVGAVILGALAIPAIALLGPMVIRPAMKVPGFGTRLDACPWSGVEVSKALQRLLDELVAAHVAPREKLKERLDKLNVFCRPRVMLFRDEHSRMVAGVWRGDHKAEIAAGYRNVLDSALLHEATHDLCAFLFGDPDHEHRHYPPLWAAMERARRLAP